MRTRKRWLPVVVSLVMAGPAGGFLLGILNRGDPDSNPVGRVMYAFLMAVMTPLHAGFPPRDNPAGGPPFNAWPHIAIAFLLILGGFVYRDWRLAKKHGTPMA